MNKFKNEPIVLALHQRKELEVVPGKKDERFKVMIDRAIEQTKLCDPLVDPVQIVIQGYLNAELRYLCENKGFACMDADYWMKTILCAGDSLACFPLVGDSSGRSWPFEHI